MVTSTTLGKPSYGTTYYYDEEDEEGEEELDNEDYQSSVKPMESAPKQSDESELPRKSTMAGEITV
jgi:hypothetical protein